MTNFEKIKKMSLEEFAKKMVHGFPCQICPHNDGDKCATICSCINGFIIWLNKEVKEQNDEGN